MRNQIFHNLIRAWKRRTAALAAGLLAGVILISGFPMPNGSDRVLAAEIDEETAAYIDEERAELRSLADEQQILALIYLCTETELRAEPSEGSDTVLTVSVGQTVLIEDAAVTFTDEGNTEWQLWLYVSLYDNEQEYSGYVLSDYVVSSDERYREWLEYSGLDPASQIAAYSAEDGETTVSYADIEQFPESYQEALRALKDAHPNWIFVPMDTGLDWSTAIANEIGSSKSLVYYTLADCMKEGQYGTSKWYYASEAALAYYMDPRNSLTEEGIFQFEQLTYNESYHSAEAVDNFLNNTFMNNSVSAPGTAKTFATIFNEVGQTLNVSPFHLASRVYQEQGDGTSALISGTYSGYEGYYNYFNISASGKTTEEVIVSGLTYAQEKGWSDAELSISGGAAVISKNYIARGQDTVYLQKFNVTSNNTYGHQYMQNITAPTSEARSTRSLYEEAGAIDSMFVFKIPVYNNMPETACAKPTESLNVVLQIPDGYSDTVWLDGVEYSGVTRNGQRIVTAADKTATNAVVYKYDDSGVPTGMYLWTLTYSNGAYTATAQTDLTDLLTYHGFSIRITGKSGIRFKTGISEELRSRLTSDGGVNGYVLKEYGTLVMNNANRASYPMIKGGEKVAGGVSYGTDENGNQVDRVYETVNGRLRYTSVLVGLPASQYRTEYAFRGYAVLEKDGVQTTVYGPVVARSIYALAQQVLAKGTYAEGTAAHTFLQQLISDAQ